MSELSTIHLLLAQVRKEREIPQLSIAEALNLDQATISLYENGHRGIPLQTLDLWADLLNIAITITPEGHEPVKETDLEQRDLAEFGRLKRRRNFLIGEMRAMMAGAIMRIPEFHKVDEEAGEGLFWAYSFHSDNDIGLVETRYDHQQKFIAVEYTSEEASVYRLDPAMVPGATGRAFMGEDEFLAIGESVSYDDMELLKAPILRVSAGSPNGIEIVSSQGFPVRSLVDIEDNLKRFAAAYDKVTGTEAYRAMENELLHIEGRMIDLQLDNRLGNGMPNPAFELWGKVDADAVSVPINESERTWSWVEEGVSWASGCHNEVDLSLLVDPERHEAYETLRDEDGSRVIGTVGPDKAPAVFKLNPAKPGLVHRVEIDHDALTEEEAERYAKIVESARELDELRGAGK